MKLDPSIRNAETKVLALMIAILAGMVGLIGFTLKDLSIDTSRVEPVHTAHAALLSVAAQADSEAGAPVAPEENWAPDESAHGLRPDAAH